MRITSTPLVELLEPAESPLKRASASMLDSLHRFRAAPEAEALEPATASVVSRLRVLSLLVRIGGLLAGALAGAVGVVLPWSAQEPAYLADSYGLTLTIAVLGGGALGYLLGYLAAGFIDWTRQVLVLLERIARH